MEVGELVADRGAAGRSVGVARAAASTAGEDVGRRGARSLYGEVASAQCDAHIQGVEPAADPIGGSHQCGKLGTLTDGWVLADEVLDLSDDAGVKHVLMIANTCPDVNVDERFR